MAETAVAVDEQVPTSDAAGASTNRSRSTSARHPSRPPGVPTADEAATKANELLAALGEDPVAFELETYADEWSASVTAYTTLDGVRWPSGYGFGFGGEGALQWASGTLAEPVATGPYPLVDLDAAIARLSEQNGMWSYGGGDVLAVDAQEAEAPAAPDEVARDRTADDVQTLPAPTDDSAVPTTPEPVVATLVDVKADLWWVWDADNSVWLLPAYTFTDTERQRVHGAGRHRRVHDRRRADDRAAARRAGRSGGRRPADLIRRPRRRRRLIRPVLDEFVGVPLPEFEEMAKRYGFTTRVVRQDGVDLPMHDGLLRVARQRRREGRRRHRDRLHRLIPTLIS